MYYVLNFKVGKICRECCDQSKAEWDDSSGHHKASGSHHYVECKTKSGEWKEPAEYSQVNEHLAGSKNNGTQQIVRDAPQGCQMSSYTGCKWEGSNR